MPRSGGGQSGESFWEHLKKAITYQWGWKLMCLVIALALWGIVVDMNGDMTRELILRDIKVTVANRSILEQRGLIVTSGTENLDNVTIRAEVPMKYYRTVDNSTFSVRLDLSRITAAGEQEVKLTAQTSNYGEVKEIMEPTVTVTVEEFTTRNRIPVSSMPVYLNEAPEGYYCGDMSVETTAVNVKGPRSVVSQIARCRILYTYPENITGYYRDTAACPFAFFDASGKELDSSSLTVTADGWTVETITVSRAYYPQTTVRLSDIGVVTGTPAEGYEIKSVSFDPSEVTIAAEDISLLTDGLAFLSENVDVTGQSESFTKAIRIYRPEEYIRLSTEIVHVTVEIGPVSEE